MENPNQCQAINNKLIATHSYGSSGNAVSCTVVNPTPPTDFHVQNGYRPSSLGAGSVFILDDQTNPQYTTPPQMCNVGRWRVITNSTAPAAMSVELTLVDSSNNEAKVTLVTNGITSVYTPLSIYKHCNDIKLVSNHQLASNDVIRALPDAAIANNNINTVLTALAKYNGLFMCCNSSDGTPRKAKLVGLPQVYNGAATLFRLYKWPDSNSGTTTASPIYTVIYVDSATANAPGFKKRIQTPIDGQLELLPGEACAWWRTTSTAALSTVTAQWQYSNLS